MRIVDEINEIVSEQEQEEVLLNFFKDNNDSANAIDNYEEAQSRCEIEEPLGPLSSIDSPKDNNDDSNNSVSEDNEDFS